MEFTTIENFTPQEFDSPDEPGSGKKMQLLFVRILDIARELYGGPIIITSGYRTKAHNQEIDGGVEDSMHTRGNAADIRVDGPSQIFSLVQALMNSIGLLQVKYGEDSVKSGLQIVVYSTHVHVEYQEGSEDLLKFKG